MRLVKPSYEILTKTDSREILKRIEAAGRTCYKSEDKIDTASAEKFINRIVRSGHESVLEHESISVRLVCDRGVSHELVRHRLAAFSQESTRYCDYQGGVAFVIPPWVDLKAGEYTGLTIGEPLSYKEMVDMSIPDSIWLCSMLDAEKRYLHLRELGWSPQQARSVLPNSLKTEIVMTANLREWRHVLKLRAAGTAGKPHPQMLELMKPLLMELKNLIPVVFDNIEIVEALHGRA